MKADNPIDLGKLQSELRYAKNAAKNAERGVNTAFTKLRAAERAFDAAKKKKEESDKAVDAAQQAVLQAARTVANG